MGGVAEKCGPIKTPSFDEYLYIDEYNLIDPVNPNIIAEC
jgi:hypothetical protein